MKMFKNRYGDKYWFEQVSVTTVKIQGNLSHWRFGGREGQEDLDKDDLGFVDPSGGPFIAVGDVIEGRCVGRIRTVDEDIYLDFEMK